MKPRVIIHNAVSIDGRIDGFPPDIGLFYGLASRWGEDATLAGADTMIAAEAMTGDEAPGTNADDSDHRPLLAVVDSRGRVRSWSRWRGAGLWGRMVSLCSESTPEDHLSYLHTEGVDALVEGGDRVDLGRALEQLADRFEVRTVRVDSGGTLNGALLRAGLVDEVSLLVHPYLVGGTLPRSLYRAEDLAPGAEAVPARLSSVEEVAEGLVWLRYEVSAGWRPHTGP